MVGIKKTLTIILFSLLVLTTGATIVLAQNLDDLISFNLQYDIPADTESGDCIISLAVHFEEGFPVSGKRFAIEQLLQIYREIWGEEDHTDIVQSILPAQIPIEVQPTLAAFNGTELLMMIFDAFGTVEDSGLLYFDEPVDLIYAETVPYYPDVPVEMINKQVGMSQRGQVDFVLDKISSDEECERIIDGNLINISAAILSYRSENLVFPLDLGELDVTGHLLVNLFNPYTGLPVSSIQDDLSVRPGDIRYEYSGPGDVSVVSYLADGSTVRRDITLYEGNDFNLLFKKTQGLSEDDRRVCIYTFQLSHVINEFYHANSLLPDKVPQIESKLFASVSFFNPYTKTPVKQIVNPLEKREGDYFYYRTGEGQYLLIGYGHNLNEVLKIQRTLGEKG